MRISFSALLVIASLLLATTASAFCGFYVADAKDSLVNDASVVVLMRGGNRTVLSMQNDYRGPVKDFALVVPVPVVLQEGDVHTLPSEVFDHVLALTSPRLVEYWEVDPCMGQREHTDEPMGSGAAPDGAAVGASGGPRGRVEVHAKFAVGEYEVVVLGADDSTALETWLHAHDYRIPAGADAYLKPYVAEGMYFFVARVNVKKVKFQGNRALLSPLRFHYDSADFSLPIRLGLINSAGEQDLVVHVIAQDRYEVASYPNATIPTNLDVQDHTREDFGGFYRALLTKTLEQNPGAVITEYAWSTASCDPCASPPLEPYELKTLGADVIPAITSDNAIVTRLHARYGKAGAGKDLVFKKAEPIVGGREFGTKGRLEHGAAPSSYNNFQARYAIRHPWTGALPCSEPIRGFWGERGDVTGVGRSARDRPKGAGDLESFLAHDVPALGVKLPVPLRAYAGAPPGLGGCGTCAVGKTRRRGLAGSLALLLAAGAWLLRRSSR